MRPCDHSNIINSVEWPASAPEEQGLWERLASLEGRRSDARRDWRPAVGEEEVPGASVRIRTSRSLRNMGLKIEAGDRRTVTVGHCTALRYNWLG